jgi:hypothetical protein
MVNPIVGPIKKPITETGIKGFLLWYKREQPHIYAKIAPQLPSIVPKAFSNYNAKMGVLFRNYSAQRPGLGGSVQFRNFMADRPGFGGSVQFRNFMADRPGMGDMVPFRPKQQRSPGIPQEIYGLGGFGDTEADYMANTPDEYAFGPVGAEPVTVDFTSTLNDPIDSTQFNYAGGNANDVNLPASPVAMAANTGSAGTPTTAAIGQVISAASQVLMTNTQAQMQQNVLQTQLQRAASGLPPLNTSLNSLGIPTISTGGSLGNSGMIFLILGGLGLLALMGKKA